MSFKVGDKVRIINSEHTIFNGLVGRVVEVRPPTRMFKYCVWLPLGYDCSFREKCVESVTKVGQQLEFEFMNKEL